MLRQDVGWSALPEATPLSVRTLLRRCLERDVKRRLRDIGEARLALGEPALDPAGAEPSSAVTSSPRRPSLSTAAAFALVALASAAAGIFAWTRLNPAASRPVTRLSIALPPGQLLTGESTRLFEARAASGRSTFQPGYSVSPDGRRFLIHLLDPRALPTRIDVVLDWFPELRAKVPVR